jgi:hypothetical protein
MHWIGWCIFCVWCVRFDFGISATHNRFDKAQAGQQTASVVTWKIREADSQGIGAKGPSGDFSGWLDSDGSFGCWYIMASHSFC